MKAIILLGAPGAGKGTMAEGIRKGTDYIHVSTGDMLREAVKAGRPVGLEAKAYMEKGELVPDQVIMKIVQERLDQGQPTDKYMFDGFPRTLEQARLLDQTLAQCQAAINKVFLLEVAREVVVDRLSGRRICRNCGAVYHIRNIQPKVPGVCDKCGSRDIYQRPDDREETVLNRLDVYEKQTASLVDYYSQKKVLVRVNGNRDYKAVQAELVAMLKD